MKRIKPELILADRQAHKAADVILLHGQTESEDDHRHIAGFDVNDRLQFVPRFSTKLAMKRARYSRLKNRVVPRSSGTRSAR
jgi:hypothetical protein